MLFDDRMAHASVCCRAISSGGVATIVTTFLQVRGGECEIEPAEKSAEHSSAGCDVTTIPPGSKDPCGLSASSPRQLFNS